MPRANYSRITRLCQMPCLNSWCSLFGSYWKRGVASGGQEGQEDEALGDRGDAGAVAWRRPKAPLPGQCEFTGPSRTSEGAGKEGLCTWSGCPREVGAMQSLSDPSGSPQRVAPQSTIRNWHKWPWLPVARQSMCEHSKRHKNGHASAEEKTPAHSPCQELMVDEMKRLSEASNTAAKVAGCRAWGGQRTLGWRSAKGR